MVLLDLSCHKMIFLYGLVSNVRMEMQRAGSVTCKKFAGHEPFCAFASILSSFQNDEI